MKKIMFPAILAFAGFLFAFTAHAQTAALSLSQNNLTLSVGQQIAVSVSGGSGAFYISSNSNSSTVSFLLSGTQITATGVSAGSATATICDQSNSSTCAALNATTQSGGSSGTGSGAVVFGQNNVSVNSGSGTIIVSMSGGSGYSISSNSNPNAVSATVYGSSIDLVASGTAPATSTITVCLSGTSSCGALNVSINGGVLPSTSSVSNNQLVFSPSSPSLTIGQTTTVMVSGGSGSYFVSSNPSPGIAGTALSGSTLTLTGVSNGTDTITICSSGGGCATITATVGTTSSGGAVVFGQTNPTLMVGQTVNISLSGGTGSYFLSSTPSSVAQASVSGSTLAIYAQSPGTAALSVCSSSGGCSILTATVNSASPVSTVATTPAATPVATTTTAAPLNATTLKSILLQIQQLTALLTQLETQALTQLQQLSASAASDTSSYKFSSYLSLGSTGTEVTALQQRLNAEGLFNGAINGIYGASTENAVMAYQTRHGISPIGIIGPATRNALNGN